MYTKLILHLPHFNLVHQAVFPCEKVWYGNEAVITPCAHSGKCA